MSICAVSATKAKSPRKFLEYLVVRILIAGLKIWPFQMRVFWIHAFLRVINQLSSNFRNRIMQNLHAAFPSRSEQWYQQMAGQSILNLARMNAEFLENPRMKPDFIERWIDYAPDRSSLKSILDSGGILVLGHLGSWEWAGVAITHLSNTELYVLAKRQKNHWSNQFIEKNRGSQNIKLIYTDENPRRAVKLLKSGALVAFIADQDAGPSAPFFPFLRRLAATYQGPAFFARLVPDVPINFMLSYHDPQGRLIVEAHPFARPDLDPRKDTAVYDRLFTYRWVKILEEYVHKYPADYYWLHRRWHSKPENPATLKAQWAEWESKYGFAVSEIDLDQ